MKFAYEIVEHLPDKTTGWDLYWLMQRYGTVEAMRRMAIQKCPNCHGTGLANHGVTFLNHMFVVLTECTHCSAQGAVIETCPN